MNTTGTAVNITGLSPTGEEYTITISAVNIVGAGPAVSVNGTCNSKLYCTDNYIYSHFNNFISYCYAFR